MPSSVDRLNVRAELVNPDDPSTNFDRLFAAADSSDVTIVSSYLSTGTNVSNPNAPEPIAQFMRALVERHPRTIVVAFGNPYLLQQVPAVSTYSSAGADSPYHRQPPRARSRRFPDQRPTADQHSAAPALRHRTKIDRLVRTRPDATVAVPRRQ